MRGEFVDLDGARLYYYAAGTRGAGEPLIFLHGFPTSSHLWRDVVPLVPDGHRIVVLDLLGFGRSDRPAGRDLSLRAHADRVLALMDALRITRAAIVGHDVGGGVAQHLAIKHPARVARMALINSVAFDDWPTREVKMAKVTLPLTRYLPPTWILSILRTDLYRGYVEGERGSHSVELYIRQFSTPEGRDVLIEHILALDPGETLAFAPRLKDIVAPTAILWGAHDPFLPMTLARRLHETIPDSSLTIIPEGRHFVPEESPETVAAVLREWLSR